MLLYVCLRASLCVCVRVCVCYACTFICMFQQVIATDGGSPQKTATATVSITVTDANNKAPSFVRPLYNTIVDECELQQRKVFISLPDTYQPVFHCYKQ